MLTLSVCLIQFSYGKKNVDYPKSMDVPSPRIAFHRCSASAVAENPGVGEIVALYFSPFGAKRWIKGREYCLKSQDSSSQFVFNIKQSLNLFSEAKFG